MPIDYYIQQTIDRLNDYKRLCTAGAWQAAVVERSLAVSLARKNLK